MVEYFIMTLLQIYHWLCNWKNFENRSTFGEVTDKSIVGCFFWLTVYSIFNGLSIEIDKNVADYFHSGLTNSFLILLLLRTAFLKLWMNSPFKYRYRKLFWLMHTTLFIISFWSSLIVLYKPLSVSTIDHL